VGATLGLLLAVALALHRRNRTANRLLAALVATFTIYLAGDVYYGSGLVRRYPHIFASPYPTPWFFGPLAYLYAVAASDRSWRFESRTLLHFVLPAIAVLATVPSSTLTAADKLAMLDRMIAGDVPRYLTILDPTKYVSGVSYSIATIAHLVRHRRTVKHSYSNTRRVSLNWLLFLTVSAMAIWLLATTLGVTDLGERLNEGLVSLAIALVVYAIGYMGLGQPEVFRHETAEYEVPRGVHAAVPSPPPTTAPRPAMTQTPPARYERSGLDAAEADRLRQSLLEMMDREQPWKDSELTLADLAARLGSTNHKLSEVLNGQLGQTFYDFVNGYRVREVQRRIKAGDAQRLKMLALALDAGFASKSTFNQAFKKHTNQTPSDFRAAAES
jgi:AraC-like DNA-binding protein